MIGYASNTGTRRNLEGLRHAGWRILVAPDKPLPPAGFRYACDNGAWGCHVRQIEFDHSRFKRFIERFGAGADFVVIPDIVADGKRSLEFSRSWMPHLRCLRLLLLPLQDGMAPDEVGAFLREYPNTGLFLGGSTEWKLREMFAWGLVAHAVGRYYHIGRVNSAKRVQLAEEAGADSFDGSGPSRYAHELPILDASRQQPRLFTARQGATTERLNT
jgi:hypothetical protein